MRDHYDLKQLRVKRKGPLPALADQTPATAKVRVTIDLDLELVEQLQRAAEEAGISSYRQMINDLLRQAMLSNSAETDAIKSALLEDRDFLAALAERLKAVS